MSNIKYDLRDLIDKLNYYTKQYDKGTPEISDKQYDELYSDLVQLEKEWGIIYPDSPTQSIHFETVSQLNKVKHNHPMLSLDKTKKVEDLQSFVKGHDWCAMFKMDGLTCSLHYIDGKFVSAETRGNGIEGEDITHNICTIKNIPLTIPTKEEIVIDGEIICDYISFSKFADKYANPRNFAAGSIRQLSSAEAASRDLSFIAWDLIKGCDDIDFFFWRLEKLDDWGFTTVPRIGDAETVKDAIEYLDMMHKDCFTWSTYPIDGYVFRFESQEYYNSLGNTDHHFRGAIAYKFYDETYPTRLKYIDWTIGRTGVLTPVAVFDPIEIEGSIVERASLHNYSIMREILGECAYVGEPLQIFKANMIIPQVAEAGPKYNYGEVVSKGGVSAHDVLEICPCCGGSVSIVESADGVQNVVCENPNCEGKLLNRVDHFCGKKGLDIKGISKATIEKLIDWGWINGLTDIFRLDEHRTEWVAKEGFGTTSVGKILDAITSSRVQTDLSAFISAIGIPLVGRTISKEIVKYYSTWADFREAVGGNWADLDGFGPEISKAINNFDYTEADEIAEMLDFKLPEDQSSNTPAAAIQGKTFVITGKVINFKNRDELKAEIESLGGKVASAISSKTDYLINNDINSTSSKNIKAKQLNIPIITESDYLKMK